MAKKLILGTLTMLLAFSCRKPEIDSPVGPVQQDVSLTLNIAANYLLDYEEGWVFLSDLDGNVLTCKALQNDTILELQNEVPFSGGDYHLTLVKRTEFPAEEPGYPDLEYLNFETFAFIQKDALSLTRQEPEYIPPIYPKAYINLHANDGIIDNFVVSSTLTAYKHAGVVNNPLQVGMKRNSGDVYAIVQMSGEQNWRHVLFEDVPSGTILNVNTSGLIQVPMSTVEVPADFESDLHILGIRTCENDEFQSIQWYVNGENGQIPARYSSGIFDRFRSNITLKKDDKAFQYLKYGSPIESYLPTPAGFTVNQNDIKDFKLNHNGGFTVIEAEWKHEESGPTLFQSASWKVQGIFPASFKAPNLPDCLTATIGWLETDEFDLESVQEKKFSSFTGFDDYFDFYFENYPSNGIGCNQYNFNPEGSLETKIKYFN